MNQFSRDSEAVIGRLKYAFVPDCVEGIHREDPHDSQRLSSGVFFAIVSRSLGGAFVA
jgi:hypothetical protein